MAKEDEEPLDPDQARFYQTYSQSPDVPACLTLLRSGKAKGVWIDLICQALREHAAENVAEIVAAFYAESDDWVRLLLLASIAETGLPDYLPLFQEILASQEEPLRLWAQTGLEKIGTKEARTVLWQDRQAKPEREA